MRHAPPSSDDDGRFFQDELSRGGVVRDWLRIVAVEAREAELLVRQLEGREDAPDGKKAERIGADEVPDLLDRMRRRDQLGLDLGVDAIEAGVIDRRRADPDVNLGRARLSEQR